MPMTSEQLDEMKAMIAVARKRELNYAVCLGKSPEDAIFLMHRQKNSEVLGRQAKKEGDTNKIANGGVSVKGKVISFTCESDPPPNFARAMKVFLTKQGTAMKVRVLNADGQELDSDGDDDTPAEMPGVADGYDPIIDPPSQSNETTAADDPKAAQWEKVAAALGPRIAQFESSGDPRGAQVAQAWQAAEAAAQGGDYNGALAVAAKLNQTMSAAAPEAASNDAPEDPDAQRWAQVQAALEGLYTRALGTNPPNRSQLEAAWGMALEKANGGDYQSALAIATKLKPRLDEALAGPSDQDSVPDDVVPFQKSRVLWAGTKTKMFSEMKKLEAAIADACQGDPELAAVANEVSTLSERLSVFDERLETILDNITNTVEGAQRSALKSEAVAALQDYRTALSDEFFQDVDSNNGFTNVSVTASANAALQSIEKVLSA